mgnify:CR=1 FL=1
MSVLDPTLDYTSKQLENSSYTHMKIVRQSGVSTASTGEDIQFELPVQAINLARSYMTIEYRCDAPGANNYNWIHEGIVPFQSLQLFTRGGQYICDIRDNCTDYSRVAMTYSATDTELEQGSSAPDATPLHCSNDLKSQIGHLTAVGSTAKRYWEQNYLFTPSTIINDVPTPTANTAIDGTANKTYKLLIPLKSIKETIFAVDKSVLFGEILVLKVKMAASDDIGFRSVASVNPNTGGALSLTNLTFSEVYLYVASERNASVVEALNAQTNSQEGFSLLVPYPTVFRNQRDAATQQNITLRLNRSHGNSLKKVRTACFSNAANKNLRYDYHNTSAGSKVSEYYTLLNNNRLSEYNVNVPANLDWLEINKSCRGTPVYNVDIYRNNWIIENEFSNDADKMSDMKTTDSNIFSGISLDQEIRYDVYATTANAAHRWMSFVHGQKVLNINSSGLVVA